MAAGEITAHCLRLLHRVQQDRVELVVTKRGIPVAKVMPLDAARDLAGSVTELVEAEQRFSTSH